MTDDLRTRIAAALKAVDDAYLNRPEPFMAEPASYEELADAVIAELGLIRVTRSQNPPIHRYVTDWKTDTPPK